MNDSSPPLEIPAPAALVERPLAERFARETAEHKMTVLHDDGLYRHLRFMRQYWRPPLAKEQRSSMYWFDLITVPGTLIFQGDGEAFTFSRVEDMFEFFRGPVGRINPDYWAEKLTSGHDRVMRYQSELLQAHIDRQVSDAVKDEVESAEVGDTLVLAGLPAAIRERITDELCGDKSMDRSLVEQFQYWADPDDEFVIPRKSPDFEFSDVWEWHVEGYHWWFLWSLHAIVWGIAQYDASRKELVGAASAAASGLAGAA